MLPKAHEWFQKALELSGPEGPVQQFELKELLDKQVEWNAHSKIVNDGIASGKLPLVVAAPAVRTTIVDVVLGNLVRNLVIADPRRRAALPLFTGRRAPTVVGNHGRVAFDITSLLVLGWLGVLEKVFGLFDQIVVPANALQELFEGRRRIRQFQKSRFRRASHLRDLLVKKIKVIECSAATNKDELSEALGADLAALIRAAEKANGIVVRPAPVLGIVDGNQVERPLGDVSKYVADTHSLLKVLAEAGLVDERKESTAKRYLSVQDKGWETPAIPNRDRTIYLDDVGIAYLQALDLLDTVVNYFPDVYIASSTADEATSLGDTERRNEECVRTIDEIRGCIRKTFENGKLVFGARHQPGEEDEGKTSSTMNLLHDLSSTSLAVFDDRALNHEIFATDPKGSQTRVATTLDLLEELRGRKAIDGSEWLSLRHKLRTGGASLMPVTEEEIQLSVQRTTRFESAEFRAIRESISLARVKGLPRFPAEVPWFVTISMAMKNGVMKIWKSEEDFSRAANQASAILDVWPKPLDWMALWEGEPPQEWANAVFTSTTAGLALPVEIQNQAARDAYQKWLRQKVLEPLRARDPLLYQMIVGQVQKFVVSAASDDADD